MAGLQVRECIQNASYWKIVRCVFADLAIGRVCLIKIKQVRHVIYGDWYGTRKRMHSAWYTVDVLSRGFRTLYRQLTRGNVNVSFPLMEKRTVSLDGKSFLHRD